MSIPKNKTDLQNAIQENYKKLCLELEQIPLEQNENRELIGHSKDTMMSINNLLAYLVGWGELVLKWNEQKNKGNEVDFPKTGYKWNELGKLAQKFYKEYENDNFETLTTKLKQNTNKILNLIESKTNTELYEILWYEK